ncbi:hypothetical protein PMAYCL1PPCAC_02230, partial [Pristionchus mayeri]
SIPAKERKVSTPDVGLGTLPNVKQEVPDANEDGLTSTTGTDLSLHLIKQEPPDEQRGSSLLTSPARLREATRQGINSLEQDDVLSTRSDTTSNCNSEGSAGLSNKQIAQRERRKREQEEKRRQSASSLAPPPDPVERIHDRKRQQKADREAARKLEEQLKREDEEAKLRKRRADTAAREAQEAREEEEKRQRREMKRLEREEEKRKKDEEEKKEQEEQQKRIEEEEKRKKEEDKKREEERLEKEREIEKKKREEEKKAENERRKEKKEDKKKKRMEERSKSRVSMDDSDSDSPIKRPANSNKKEKEQPLQKRRRNTIETSSDESMEEGEGPSSSAAPVSHRTSTSSTSSTPLPPSSSTARAGAASGRGLGWTPLPPSLPKPSQPEKRAADKLDVNYAGKGARVPMHQLPKIPKKTPLPPPPVPVVHPSSDPPAARSTPIGEQRKRAAMAAADAAEKERTAAALLAARKNSDGTERKSTVKQPRSKLKPPPVSLEKKTKEPSTNGDTLGDIMDLMSSSDASAEVPPPPEKRLRMEMGGASTSIDGRNGPSTALSGRTAARMLSASSLSPSFTSPTYSSSPSNSPLYSQQPHQQQQAAPSSNPMMFTSTFSRPPIPGPPRGRKETRTNSSDSVPPSVCQLNHVIPEEAEVTAAAATTLPPAVHPLPSGSSAATRPSAAAASLSSETIPGRVGWMPDLHTKPIPSPTSAVPLSSPSVPSSSHLPPLDPRLHSQSRHLMDPRRKPSSQSSFPPAAIPTPSNENMVNEAVPNIPQTLTNLCFSPPPSNRVDEWSRLPPAVPSTSQSIQSLPDQRTIPPPTQVASSSIYESVLTDGKSHDPRQCPKLAKKVPTIWASMEQKVVEWEEEMKREWREKERDQDGWTMRPVEGIVWSEYKRLATYRQAHWHAHKIEKDGICKSCSNDTRREGRKRLKMQGENPYTILNIDFPDFPTIDYECVEAMKKQKEAMGGESSTAPPHDDTLVTLRAVGGNSNEESSSNGNGEAALVPGYDDGVVPSNVAASRRAETEEERIHRMDFFEKLQRGGILPPIENVVDIDKRVVREIMENEEGLEDTFHPEWKKKLTAWNESTSAASSANLLSSVAGSGGSSKSTRDSRGESSSNGKKVRVISEEKLARIRGKNEEFNRSHRDGEKSSSSAKKHSPTGISTTHTVKSKGDTRSPSSSSSRPSDAHIQRSRDATESPRASTSALSPRMTSSTALSSSTSIPGLSPDNWTRAISRSSNEENRPSSSSMAQPTSSDSDAASNALSDAKFQSVQKILRQLTGTDKQVETIPTVVIPHVPPPPMMNPHLLHPGFPPQFNPMNYPYGNPMAPTGGLYHPYNIIPTQPSFPPQMGMSYGVPPPHIMNSGGVLPPSVPPPAAESGRQNTEKEEEKSREGKESTAASEPMEERPSTSRGEAVKEEEREEEEAEREEEEEETSEDYWRAPASSSGNDEDKLELRQGCEPRPEPFIRCTEWPKTTYEEDCRTICVAKGKGGGETVISIKKLKKYFERHADLEEIRIKRTPTINVAFIRLKKHSQVSPLLHMNHSVDGTKLYITSYLSKATMRPN